MDNIKTELLGKSTCPNCWHDFPVENVKWIAGHQELIGDYRLGDQAPRRFRPSRYDIGGNALDIKGIQCQELACPNCHLKIPRSVLVFAPFFLSIAGRESCGKSFYLASMTWQIRKTFPSGFKLNISDSDGDCNRILNDYEEQLFFNSDPDGIARILKTDTVGEWYSEVQFDDQSVRYPKPFYFDLRPSNDHYNTKQSRRISRLLCLYDNSGESFKPGEDSVSSPVTRHLGLAESWLFCFDPTQDPRFRRELSGRTDDPQVNEPDITARQESVLNEMINRIRRHSSLGLKQKSKKPLIIVCTKLDAWSSLLGDLPQPWAFSQKLDCNLLDMDAIESISKRLLTLLQRLCPEVASAAQSISDCVYFIPVSATGVAPTKDPSTGAFLIRTDRIAPIWCEVPILIALAHRAPKLVKAGKANKPKTENSSELSADRLPPSP